MNTFHHLPSATIDGERLRRSPRIGAAVLAAMLTASLVACQPKPTVVGAAAPVPAAPAQPVPAPAALPAPAEGPVRAVPGPVAAAPATSVAAVQPVPVYNDAGPVAAPPAPQAVQPAPVQRLQPLPATAAAPVASNRLGRVTSVEPIRERPAGTGAGGVAGAAIGGLVGNHFGHGTGRAALTVLGLAGGAVAGNTVERNLRERTVGYRVGVRLDNGEVRTYEEPGADLRVGDRVRVAGHSVRRV